MKTKKIPLLLAVLIVLLGIGISSGLLGLNWGKFKAPQIPQTNQIPQETIKVVKEESVVIDVVEKVSPSVVTIGISKTRNLGQIFEINPFDPFSIFKQIPPPAGGEKVEQDIGTGFIISSDGMIVTNKHVAADTQAKYRVITKDDKTYEVSKIYRDPVNDLAILKIDPSTSSGQALKPVEMGDSSKLKVGQFVIAIGTALGEFRNTVTTGVISGLGRGITAGSPFEGYVERLDNVIQTDAAINPGNSGGPLLNSAGQVIGVNVAVAQGSQNIGFAIPINVIRESLENFNKTGK
ncbi:trypsin-like peptidase domain-containing protein, partial [Candidatus Gottesmanbacteria bacterium]|nr:trypsin-like peptidase domain-containing protein [Candidatus Gottesmanbacteria bacterium]